MLLRNTFDRFGLVAITLHWLTLVLLIGSFMLGLSLLDMPLSPRKLQFYSWHKWFGVTVFLVTILRLGWRHLNPVPEQPTGTPRWRHLLASLSHGALYAIIIIMPLTGWIMSATLNFPVVFLGFIQLPNPFGVDPAVGAAMQSVHNALAITLLIIIAVHSAAALYHHFMLRDNVLRRMLPWPNRLHASRADR
jgi:cytochrome b561